MWVAPSRTIPIPDSTCAENHRLDSTKVTFGIRRDEPVADHSATGHSSMRVLLSALAPGSDNRRTTEQ